MPDRIEPTPEVPQGPERDPGRNPERDSAEPKLTTASLARAAEDGAHEPTRSFASASAADGDRHEPLFAGEESARLRAEWDEVQASFVDEPRAAVEQADRLVATAIKRLAEIFAEEKGRLEGQWDRGGEVSTEDLRQALRRYRAFFGRVLSV
ncbi:MAG TPA: hypothetical protein VGF50_02285 [Caulobacteraceae bacterium]|jgi:hypothetical protein